MKNKIIAIFVAVITIASCVSFGAIGASAEDVQYFKYNDVILPSIYTIDNYGVYGIYIITVKGGEYELWCTNTVSATDSTNNLSLKPYSKYILTYNAWVFSKSDDSLSVSMGVANNSGRQFVWSDTDIYHYNTGELVYTGSIPTSPRCDGSTCPATDANTDNICDDCGMVFAVLRSYDAPDPYLAWTVDRQVNYPYAFIYKNEIDANVFIMASTRPYVQDGQIVIDTNGDTTSYLKYTQWGNDWRLAESYDFGTTITTDTLVSSFNILDTDGNIVYYHDTDFFPVPLWVEMENLTQGEMANKFIPKMGGLIMIVTACGVGCLALLAVLRLFGKRSLIHRS